MNLSTLIDRAVIYGGGSGVVVSAQTLQAQTPEHYSVTLLQFPLPLLEITIGDACTIIATMVVISKGVLDYLTYRDKRADRTTRAAQEMAVEKIHDEQDAP